MCVNACGSVRVFAYLLLADHNCIPLSLSLSLVLFSDNSTFFISSASFSCHDDVDVENTI